MYETDYYTECAFNGFDEQQEGCFIGEKETTFVDK